MKAYIAISFSKKEILSEELKKIVGSLQILSIAPFVFVNQYIFNNNQFKEMMQQAFADISTCDFVIAETSFKEIGIGIEVGYAKAKNKPVIYLRKHNEAHSTTMEGTSDHQIIYQDKNDLSIQLSELLKQHFIIPSSPPLRSSNLQYHNIKTTDD